MNKARSLLAMPLLALTAALGAPGEANAQATAAQSVLDRNAAQQLRGEAQVPAAGALHAIPVEIAPSASVVASTGTVMLGAVTVTGLKALTPADFADVASSYVGRVASAADLAELAGRMAQRARERGYKLASASIPAQHIVAGVVAVALDEGRIDAIRFEGPEQAAVRATLQPLINGSPVRFDELERRLLIAQDVGEVKILASRFARENGRGVLVIKVETRRVTGRVTIANDETRPLGTAEARVDVDAYALLFADDTLSASYSNAIGNPDALHYGRARYAKRIGGDGTEVSVTGSASGTHAGSYLAGYDLSGGTWSGALGVSRPLERSRATSLWITTSLNMRALWQDQDGQRVRRDRTAALRLGLYGNAALLGGRARVNATLSQGLDLFGATGASDLLATRSGADPAFTSLDSWADWTHGLGGRFSLRAAGEAQIASGPLLISEQIGLGGGSFLRGYDFSERSGDEGAMGSMELRYNAGQFFNAVPTQFYVFADGGKVVDLRGGSGGGSLASAGSGLRADLSKRIGATLELALPLTGPRYDAGNRDARINVALTTSF